MQCKIDEGRDEFVKVFGEEAAAALELAYTNAVNTLLSRGDTETFISVPEIDPDTEKPTGGQVTGTASAAKVAAALIRAKVGYDPQVDKKPRIMKSHELAQRTNLTPVTYERTVGISFWSNPTGWRMRDYSGMVAWTHEGIHLSGAHESLGPRKTWETLHDVGFNQAASRLLGRWR
ncbi:MAG: hypothetical protein R3E77_10325 [Steroidobacteraceae bacterium]